MATITASGLASGLDTASMISQLMSLERQPINTLQTRKSSFETKISSLGQIKSSLEKLQTAAKALTSADSFGATKATVPDGAGFSVSTTSSASAASYAVQVENLAHSQRIASNATSAPSVGAGSLTIELGTLSGGSFTADVDRTTNVTFSGSTLAELRDAINATDSGVTAKIINNGTVDQLVLSSDETGADQAFRISGSSGLSGFIFDPAAPTGGSLTSLQSAEDAKFLVDGLTITRPTNTVTDVLDGVTLTLKAKTTAEETLTIDRDPSKARSAVDNFVTAYNALNSQLRTMTSYNADSGKAGVLNGDSSVRSIQAQVRNVLSNSLTGLDGASSLYQIGMRFDATGNITVDGTKLDAALADPTKKVAELFGGNGTVSGYAQSLDTLIGKIVGTDGTLAARQESLTSSVKAFDERIASMELRMTSIETRYRAQFTALESMISSMNTTSSFLTQQLSALA